jgi:DNA (cytosine-5)-methyltransferase 1
MTLGPLDVSIIDIFAGGGGVSHGVKLATGISPLVAINHSAAALRMHAANHPNTLHLCEDAWAVKPFRPLGRLIDLIWGSPDCCHHSAAKGAKPLDNRIRGLCWSILPWLAEVRPRILCLENVPEFEQYGPLHPADHPDPKLRMRPIKHLKGSLFRGFVAAIRALGYIVEWRTLVACDYGAPTARKRFILIARCDGQPIRWPKKTHGPGVGQVPQRTAGECLDYSKPCPSIFDRKKPLAENTMRRLAAGVRRFVLEADKPYFIDGQYVPNLVSTRNGERKGQAPRVRAVDEPMWTVTAQGSQGALQLTQLVKGRRDTPGARKCAAFLMKYYGRGTGQSLDEPLHTILSKARFGLVCVEMAGEDFTITDIGFRMLATRELARGQGFEDDYIIPGTIAEQTARIGNSVPPQLAAAVVGAQFGLAPWA